MRRCRTIRYRPDQNNVRNFRISVLSTKVLKLTTAPQTDTLSLESLPCRVSTAAIDCCIPYCYLMTPCTVRVLVTRTLYNKTSLLKPLALHLKCTTYIPTVSGLPKRTLCIFYMTGESSSKMQEIS
jgi:hypothetical protein